MLSIASNSALIALKLAAGAATGSIAVVSEAAHSFLDLLAALMTFAAVRVSGAPPDHDHPFGHGRAENIAALFEALLIIAGGLYIVRESVHALGEGGSLDSPGAGAAVMLASSLVNLLVSRHLFRTGRRYASPALVTDAWHLMTDVYTSLGILAALLAIQVGLLADPSLDLGFIDPAAAMCVSFFIIKTGWNLARDALATLADHSLPDEDLRAIAGVIRSRSPGILGYRRLRTRRSGPFRIMAVDLVVDGALPVSEAHAMGVEVSRAIAGLFPRSELIFHLEPAGHPGHGAGGGAPAGGRFPEECFPEEEGPGDASGEARSGGAAAGTGGGGGAGGAEGGGGGAGGAGSGAAPVRKGGG
jgi:cation diffusion facilitator family transporter